MPGSESVVLSPLQTVLRWGLVALIAAGCIAGVAALVRLLARRWRARARALGDELASSLAAIDRSLVHLRTEAAAYRPDVPPPYGPIIRDLQSATQSIGNEHSELSERAERVQSQAPDLPETAWRKLGFWFWQDPVYWWRRRGAVQDLVARMDAPRSEAEAADELLRDLRRQPLDTAEQARALLDLVDTAQHTVGLLKSGGVRGDAIDRAQVSLTEVRSAFNDLPVYLFAGTDSQIVRRALPEEIAAAWETVGGREAGIRATATQTVTWHEAYTRSRQELREMQQRIEIAEAAIEAAPMAVDTSEPAQTLAQARTQAEILHARFEEPTIEDLDRVNEITGVAAEVGTVIEELGALSSRHAELESVLAGVAAQLAQIGRQLRQLAEAGRYPLDHVPLQAELDLLADQVRALDTGDADAPARARSSAEVAQALAAAQHLAEEARLLGERVATAREQRRRLIELLDQWANTTQVDWAGWAGDLHQRTQPYDPANWSQAPANRGRGRLSDKIREALTPQQPLDDPRVQSILQDAAELVERRDRWVPAHVDAPLQHDRLEEQAAGLLTLSADIDAFQDRLDAITQRFQQCQEIEERAKADLATVYGAVDRLDMAAADVLPPGLANEDNHWSRCREKLDAGYELELALAKPETRTVDEKALRVAAWIGQTRDILLDWQKALGRETADAAATLTKDLDDLAAVAPLDTEPAVERAQRVADTVSGQTSKARGAQAKRRGATQEPSAATAELCGGIVEQLRDLATVDETLAGLKSEIIVPLTAPIERWREAEQEAETRFTDLLRLEHESARLWPPVSLDTATVKAEFGEADRVRDQLYQHGRSVTHVVDTLKTLTETYNGIVAMVEDRERVYHDQRPVLNRTLGYMETWCARLERYRGEHAGDDIAVAAIRARLDEIEASWTQLQIRYDQAEALIPSEEALRSLNDLWRQARRQLPLGPGQDILTADEIEER